MPSDTDLLSRFCQSRDERAFEELVQRHLGLVLGAARRRLPGRADLAEDVAQRVFVTLVRKAKALEKHPCLPAWLQKCAAYEALRAARRELSHTKTMNKLRGELESARNGPERNPLFEAALPILDEALAALGAGDRRALLLRFYEEKSFREIALLCGKSEAASQKQTRRALDKLGGLLGRRGVAVPATVLATGLTGELARGAAVETANSIAASALNEVSSAGAGTAALLTELTLMKTKTALLVGSAVLIACAATGYVAGRAAIPEVKLPAPKSAEASVARERSDAKPLSTPGRSTGTDRETLRALLDLARIELQKGDHDVIARARAEARLAAIPLDQIPAALDLIAAMPGGLDGEAALTDALLTHWAAHDGKAACDYSLENRTPLARGIPPIRFPLTAWAEVAPQAALDWYLARAAEDHPALKEGNFGRFQAISNVRWVMTAWIHHDLEGAMAAYRTLEDEKHRQGALIAFSEYAGAVEDCVKLLELFAQAPKMGRDMGLRQALQSWSRERPEELAKWVDEHEVEHVDRGFVANAVLSSWVVTDADAAVDWWMTREDQEDKKARILSLMRTWAEADVLGAGEWLAKQDLDESYDSAIREYSFKASRSDPERAWAWALRVTDEKIRSQALKGVVRQWIQKAPEDAAKTIDASTLSPEQKSTLLEVVNEKLNLTP